MVLETRQNTKSENGRREASDVERLVMPDDDKWLVCWEYKDGSAKGHGEPVSKKDAEAAAEWANDNYPQIRHWVIQA